MAIAGSTLDAVSFLLKDYYLQRVDYLFKKKYPWLKRFKRRQRKLAGNVFTHPVMTAESWGIGAGAYTADLPTPGTVKGITPSWSPRAHRGRVRVYDRTRYATASNRGAFLKAWSTETESMVRAFMVMLNLESLGDGKGAVAYLASAQDSDTPTVFGWQGPTGSHMVQRGMSLDLIDATDDSTVLSSANVVLSRTKTALTLTSALAGSAADDYFVLSGSLGYAIDGLKSIVSSSDPALANYGGLDRDLEVNDRWKAQEVDFGDNFTLDLLDQLYESVDEYSDGTVDTILTRKQIRRVIAREMWSQVRYNTLTLEGRWQGLTYDGKPIITDPCVWEKSIFCLDSKMFELASVGNPNGQWMDFDGSIPHRVDDKEAFEATYTSHISNMCHAPNASARGYDVVAPVI